MRQAGRITGIFSPLLRLWGCSRGVAAIEMAVLAPLLILFFVGTVELGRAFLIQQKLEKAASTIADYVAQNSYISRAGLENAVASTPTLMQPWSSERLGVVVSMITYNTLNPPPPCDTEPRQQCLLWQYRSARAPATETGTNTPGTFARVPRVRTAVEENYVVVEVGYDYHPILPDVLAELGWVPNLGIRAAVTRPRDGGVILSDLMAGGGLSSRPRVRGSRP